MKDKIENYLNKFDFDIRKSKNARFIDHKVTADILTIIADCVVEFIEQPNKEEFTVKDIWEFKYSNENIKEVFGKPEVLEKNAKSEYDKFFAQSLIALAYGKILNGEKKKGKWYFTIENKIILDFLAIRERNSLIFLNIYLTKVLNDSNIWDIFNNFFEFQTKEKLKILKDKYKVMIKHYTKTQSELDINRMFPKVLNPLAYTRKKLGIIDGRISKDIIGLNNLFYNRKNWRDLNKKKDETREEYSNRELKNKNKNLAYQKYSLQKAKKLIKKYHSPHSEVRDEFSNGEATQIHHIFMKSEFPSIDSYLENLILLTATQHLTKAHPSNNTRIIDIEYQRICLDAKFYSIEKFPDLYSMEDFEYIKKIGYHKNIEEYDR